METTIKNLPYETAIEIASKSDLQGALNLLATDKEYSSLLFSGKFTTKIEEEFGLPTFLTIFEQMQEFADLPFKERLVKVVNNRDVSRLMTFIERHKNEGKDIYQVAFIATLKKGFEDGTIVLIDYVPDYKNLLDVYLGSILDHDMSRLIEMMWNYKDKEWKRRLLIKLGSKPVKILRFVAIKTGKYTRVLIEVLHFSSSLKKLLALYAEDDLLSKVRYHRLIKNKLHARNECVMILVDTFWDKVKDDNDLLKVIRNYVAKWPNLSESYSDEIEVDIDNFEFAHPEVRELFTM